MHAREIVQNSLPTRSLSRSLSLSFSLSLILSLSLSFSLSPRSLVVSLSTRCLSIGSLHLRVAQAARTATRLQRGIGTLHATLCAPTYIFGNVLQEQEGYRVKELLRYELCATLIPRVYSSSCVCTLVSLTSDSSSNAKCASSARPPTASSWIVCVVRDGTIMTDSFTSQMARYRREPSTAPT